MNNQIKLKYSDIFFLSDKPKLFWIRGKESFTYSITDDLVKKAQRSSKDELEVMFYCENKRWPKDGELEHYNETSVKTYIGSFFTIYEEDGKYEITVPDYGGSEKCYPITEEQKNIALASDEGGIKVQFYAQNGYYPPTAEEYKEAQRQFLRKNLDVFLRVDRQNFEKYFDPEELDELIEKAKKLNHE